MAFTYRLGKKRPVRDPRTAALFDFLKPLPAAPETWDVSRLPQHDWGMLSNDSKADCTCAAACHMDMVWEAVIGNMTKFYTDAECLAFYDRVNGGHDDGAVELFVLREWQQNGITGADDALFAYMSVNRANHQLVKQASWLFQGLYLGVALPLTAQDQAVWDVSGDWQADPYAQPGSWGGHAVNSVAFDKDTITVTTWGATKEMTWRFWDCYCEEAYALMPGDWQKQSNAQAIHDGLKVSDLDDYLKSLRGRR